MTLSEFALMILGRNASRTNRAVLAVAAGMLLSASACQTPRQSAQTPPAGADAVGVIPPAQISAPQLEDRQVEHAVVAEQPGGAGPIELLGYESAGDPAVASIQIAQAETEAAPEQPPDAPAVDPIQPVQHAADPRTVLPGEVQPAPPDAEGPVVGFPYLEELIVDGGDRAHPFHYEGFDVAGLDTEDTVAEFIDEEGERHVRISSRTYVYAPRFGAVRTISQPVYDHSVAKLAGAHDRQPASGFESTLNPETGKQTDQLSAMRLRSRASGLETETAEMGLHLAVSSEEHAKTQNIGEDRGFVGGGQFDQTDEASQAYGLQTAGAWSRDLNPVIVANDQFGQQIFARRMAQDYTAVEDRRTPGDLTITKESNRTAAQPGETITFTIRFKNSGERELSGVRILDHLTPRVQYVPGTAVSELDGGLTLEEEEDGSQVLVFELAAPLGGGEEGEITFQVKLR